MGPLPHATIDGAPGGRSPAAGRPEGTAPLHVGWLELQPHRRGGTRSGLYAGRLLVPAFPCDRNEQFKILDSIRPLEPGDVVRGQYRGYRGVKGVKPDSNVETFAALRLRLDTWRWADVPFYIRTGKSLPVTATEVLVELRRSPLDVFGGAEAPDANYVRFRLSPDMSISLGARAKTPGDDMVGQAVELEATHQSVDERPPYQRLIGDAIRGDQSLFTREDAVEAAWRIVDPALEGANPVHEYEPGSWGPAQADRVLEPGSHWHDPTVPPR